MTEKVVNFNIQAAKKRIQDFSGKALNETKGRLAGVRERMRDNLTTRRKDAASKVLDKGIALTKRQLSALEDLKKRSSTSVQK